MSHNALHANKTALHVVQVTTMLSHVEEVGKAALPDQAELDTLRGNVAKQQQKVDQLSTPQPSANGAQVLFVPPVPPCIILPQFVVSCKQSNQYSRRH